MASNTSTYTMPTIKHPSTSRGMQSRQEGTHRRAGKGIIATLNNETESKF